MKVQPNTEIRTEVPAHLRESNDEPKATEKQVSYIHSLLDERDLFASPVFFDRVNAMDVQELENYIATLKRQAERLSKRIASEWISRLADLPRKSRPAQPSNRGDLPSEAGMYRATGGTIIRVYLGQRSGKLLVKQVIGDKDSGYGYEYVGAVEGRGRGIATGAKPLSLEEAKEWGKMTGHCCVCARRLDVPESVEAGIGPVCAGRLEV